MQNQINNIPHPQPKGSTSVTAQEWLAANNKQPFRLDYNGTEQWYWGGVDNAIPTDEDWDMLLPDELFNRMQGQRTYNNCRRYPSQAEALADFERAYNALYRTPKCQTDGQCCTPIWHNVNGLEPNMQCMYCGRDVG